jgi:hypothetical protein
VFGVVSSGGLVVLGGEADDQVFEELAGGGVDDADVVVLAAQDDGVRAWVRSMPMWWRRPWLARVTTQESSIVSWRTR